MKNNIKAAREKQGLTQQECAELFNVKLRAWQTYEQGVSEPKFEVLCKIADKFGVTTDYLLGRDSQKSNELTPTQREEIATQKWLSLDKEKRDALLQMMETCIKTFEAAESNHKK